jgi:type II secretory pathway pseudopilin PulG
MVAKFPIVIAAVVAVMLALILLPSFNNNNKSTTSTDAQAQLSLQYDRQQLSRREPNAVLAATSADILTIENDGSAKYRKLVGAPNEKTFTITSDEMRQLKGLILDTGFMTIPATDYMQKEGLVNVTKYTIKVNANSSSSNNEKTINWVDPDSYNGTIPPIIINVGSTLDSIISKYT